MTHRVAWILVAVLCIAATSCNKKVKKSAPATESKKNEQSLVEQRMLELAQASEEYSDNENTVTDEEYDSEDQSGTNDDDNYDSEYDSNEYSDEDIDTESTSEETDDDASGSTGW